MKKTPIFIVLICLWLPSFSFAGTTGKLAGRVTDASTGSALPGVNVIVEGTTIGAATNANGYYVILNVPPGKYSLKFSMIGYAEYRIKNALVEIDLTTTLNAKLTSKVISGKEVVVVAERPIVARDVSASMVNIRSKDVSELPVQTINQVLTLQAGIEQGTRGIVIRGGGPNQTAFMVDGLSLNDERSNIPYAAVSLSSVKEIQVQTGGFNAEYGNVRSGIVNVITREGGKTRYAGSAIFRYSPPRPKHFGRSLYGPDSYFNRPHLDPAVCWTGTNNGAWDEYTQHQYSFFEGWNAVSDATMQDSDPTNDLTPAGAKRLYEWQHRRQGDIKKPDYVVDVGFGGPVPLIGQKLGDLRFYATHFRERSMFVFPLSRSSYSDNHTQLKMTSDLSPSMKLVVTGLYSEVYSVSPYNWTTTPTGRVLKGTEEVANLLNSGSGASILYMPGYFSPTSIYRTMFGAKFTHVLSPQTFYEIIFENTLNRYNTFRMSVRDTTRKYQVIPGYYVDEAPEGYWGYSATGVGGMSMGGWMNLGLDKSRNSTTHFKFDLTSQVDQHNQVKTGLQFTYNAYRIRSFTNSPSMNTWTRSMVYNVFPYRLGMFVQDKLEFQGFVANVGIRFDYANPNGKWYDLSEYDKYFQAGYGNRIETQVPLQKIKADWDFSPRVGVSHPITDNSKLYFNYGHFQQEPYSSYRFRLQRESNGLVTYIGNPNMTMEKTVAYELGFSQNLFNMVLLNIAAYYKDVTHQPGWIFYQNINNSVQYHKAANNNYADIRGFEITLNKRIGRWVTGFLNYTYDVTTSGYFGLLRYYEDPNKERDYLRLNPYQSRPHPRPYARANLNFHTPNRFGKQWLGVYPLGGWNWNILADWKAGSYTTYNPNSLPGVVDNVRWKDWYNVNMRLSKVFSVLKYGVQLYVDIANVFNTRHLSYAGFSDKYDYLDYLSSLNFSWETGVEHGNDKIGEYRPEGVAYDPLEPNPNNDSAIRARNEKRKKNKSYIDMPNLKSVTFLNPRDITIGIKINF
ncbi:TonB dependent receptor [bacterium BMS3Abin05]|nr:TonB dependent receptor [bacterium BMS3Abin05]GBE27130.1 TonB dependent receptor [bacterium BMS3Bbin03]